MENELDYKKMWEMLKNELKEDGRWYKESLAYSVKVEDPVGSLDYSQQLVYVNKTVQRMAYIEDVVFGRWDDEEEEDE